MVIWGWKTKVIPGSLLHHVHCTNCGETALLSFGNLRYFHMFWIPVLPTHKDVGTECGNCGHYLYGKDVPKELRGELKSIIFGNVRKLPFYSGLIVIGLVFAAILGVATYESAQKERFVANPALNDLYIVDFSVITPEAEFNSEHRWGAMRVQAVTSSEVVVQISLGVYDDPFWVTQDVRDGTATNDSYYYDAREFTFEIERLREFNDAGAIYSIERQ